MTRTELFRSLVVAVVLLLLGIGVYQLSSYGVAAQKAEERAVATGPDLVGGKAIADFDAASRATQAAREQGKKRKPISATFKGRYPVPLQGMLNALGVNAGPRNQAAAAAGGAKTGVTLGGAWSGTLEVLNQESAEPWNTDHLTNSVSASAITCTVSIAKGIASGVWGDAQAPAPGDPPEIGYSWHGYYINFDLTVTAGGGPPSGTSDTVSYWLWIGDYWKEPPCS